ncbi:hypothetical protein BKA56DRAFT_647580 [Ilyonectria sp. MPI-CAGE-AT-0026]|nr:hypothetical protein BKA56DRAFT_647580 [Ilyonectria sp. MPI-CAGE-AT-0026]
MVDDEIRARFAAANALLKRDTVPDVEDALEQFSEILRLRRSDNLGVRDIIPHLLLRLERDQECYDFLKWWATVDDEDHYNGRYNWDDTTLPYLDIRGADVFEPTDLFFSGAPSLSHLVALTLLKLHLYLDLSAYDESRGGFGEPSYALDRPVGRLSRQFMRTMRLRDISTKVDTLKDQYLKLCQVVHEANPFFWEALVADEAPSLPSSFSPGSQEEADLVLHQCQRAWQDIEDAILMVDADTCGLTRVYEGKAADAGVGNPLSEALRKGTGKVFPSRFEPPLPTSHPAELFPPTPMVRSQTIRFISRNDRNKVLVYTDGACSNNGQLEPRAGWAVVCAPPGNDDECYRGGVSGRLEDKGPFGDDSVATSNRAELRAAIGALRLRDWQNEGYDSIVIATDSSYVVDGATGWAKGWVRNGWKTRNRDNVKNRDLWEVLLGEVERWKDQGMTVDLWKIPRELNGDADAAAKRAAQDGAAKAEYITFGFSFGSSQITTTATGPSSRVLTLCLEGESLFDACCGNLVSHISSKAKMERATTPEAALTMLRHQPPPSVILVVDGALTRQRKGATVVLAGCFSSMMTGGQFNRFFARLGLPWQRGSYHRTDVSLRSGVVDGHLTSRLPSSYSQKALFVKGIERSAAWYTESETSNEAAVVFAKVGSGRLGYVGDVNGEEGSNLAVLAMCGLLN